MANLVRDRLVDGNPRADIRRALVEPHARQKNPVAARMVASAVGTGAGVEVVESTDDLQAIAQSRERLERRAELKIRSTARGPPGGGNRPVGKIHKRRAQRRASRRGRKSLRGLRGEHPIRHK